MKPTMWGPNNPPPKSPGRPKADFTKAECERLARAEGPEMLEVLVKVAKTAKNATARVVAADKVIDRAVGKAQSLDVEEAVNAQMARVFAKLKAKLGEAAYLELLEELVDEPKALAVNVEQPPKAGETGPA